MGNPLIFAIETSGKTGGITFYRNKVLGSVIIHSHESYNKILFCSLPFLMESAGVSLEDVDFYAIDVGPGSFTGLRIGLSVLKAFTFVHPKPVIPILSLEALCMNYISEKLPLVSLVDAYTKEVFFASYVWEEEKLKCLLPPRCVPLKDVISALKNPSIFLSETLEKWETELTEGLNELFKKPLIPPILSPELVAKLAYLKLLKGEAEFLSGEEILPFYLKASEAERKTGKLVS